MMAIRRRESQGWLGRSYHNLSFSRSIPVPHLRILSLSLSLSFCLCLSLFPFLSLIYSLYRSRILSKHVFLPKGCVVANYTVSSSRFPSKCICRTLVPMPSLYSCADLSGVSCLRCAVRSFFHDTITTIIKNMFSYKFP
jgi:hypothetical protein